MGAVSSTTEPDADKIVHANFTLSRTCSGCADHQRRFVYASSAATYGDARLPGPDGDPVRAPAAEHHGWSRRCSTCRPPGLRIRAAAMGGLKFFNVYGPNEEHKHSMKSVASQIWPRVRHAVQLFKSYREGSGRGQPATSSMCAMSPTWWLSGQTAGQRDLPPRAGAASRTKAVFAAVDGPPRSVPPCRRPFATSTSTSPGPWNRRLTADDPLGKGSRL